MELWEAIALDFKPRISVMVVDALHPELVCGRNPVVVVGEPENAGVSERTEITDDSEVCPVRLRLVYVSLLTLEELDCLGEVLDEIMDTLLTEVAVCKLSVREVVKNGGTKPVIERLPEGKLAEPMTDLKEDTVEEKTDEVVGRSIDEVVEELARGTKGVCKE